MVTTTTVFAEAAIVVGEDVTVGGPEYETRKR